MKPFLVVCFCVSIMGCRDLREEPYYEVAQYSNAVGETYWQVHYIHWVNYGTFDDMKVYEPVEIFKPGNTNMPTKAQADSVCDYLTMKLKEKRAHEFHEE